MQPLTPEPQGAGLGAPPFLGQIRVKRSPFVTYVTGDQNRLSTSIKWPSIAADMCHMIISDEQAHMAAYRLADAPYPCTRTTFSDVDPSVIECARARALLAPDAREDRVIQAKARLLTGLPNSHDIAQKMVSRIVSDALR